MRRLAILVVVFVLGGILTYAVIRGMDRLASRAASRGNHELAAILDRPPVAAGIPDSTLVKAAARIERSVVNIDTLEASRRGFDIWGMPVYAVIPGKASGVIISPSGHVLTNSHVVQNANRIRVTVQSGEHYDGRVIASDPDADLAIVKIEGRNLVPADLGNSDELKIGEYVLAIGNPLGIGTTVTHGIISATNRRNLQISEGRILREALQTDAAINPGNSGGALANQRGQLIGINTAIASPSGGSIGLGFAIPVNTARRVLKELLSGKQTTTATSDEPFIGITSAPVAADLANRIGLQPGLGIRIAQVTPGAGAASAGLQAGMIIIGADGRAVGDPEDVREAVRRHQIGETITLRAIFPDGTVRDVPVRIGRHPRGA